MSSLKDELRKRMNNGHLEDKHTVNWDDISPGFDDCLSQEEQEYIESTKVRNNTNSRYIGVTVSSKHEEYEDNVTMPMDTDTTISLLDTIEAIDDDDLAAITAVTCGDIDSGTMKVDCPSPISTHTGNSVGGQLHPSSQSFDEIAEEGERLLSELEDSDKLRKLLEELESMF